jgi:hypothetical protein
MSSSPGRLVATCLVAVLVLAGTSGVESGAYIFAGEANGVNVVTHSQGYVGAGGALNITVGIDPTSANAASMATSVQNIVNTFNSLAATTGNLVSGGANNVPATDVDFESVALHEVGHSLGLAHVNAASESLLPSADRNYTKATDGINNVFDLSAGVDGIKGSSDDIRGDDVNLHWFRTSNNNPFTIAGTVDSTTYTRNVASLPGGHTFAANADRSVSVLLGVPSTESIMQQGTFFDEAQRTLNHDDVATLRYAMSGLDETAGTADDYTLNLSYAGLTAAANIVLDFDNSQTGFAVSASSGAFVTATHVRVTTTAVYFNTGFNWFFNDVPNAGAPPTITTGATPSVPENQTAVIDVNATDADGDTEGAGLTYTLTGGADQGLFSIVSGTGVLTFITAPDFEAPTDANTDNDYEVEVTVTDSTLLTDVQAMVVTVTDVVQAPFTDDPLVVSITAVRTVHIDELRARVNALRVVHGAGVFAFTDPVLAVGGGVRAVHLTELRTALNGAYVGAGQPVPIYTDPGLGVGTTIRAIHIAELRAAVLALEPS